MVEVFYPLSREDEFVIYQLGLMKEVLLYLKIALSFFFGKPEIKYFRKRNKYIYRVFQKRALQLWKLIYMYSECFDLGQLSTQVHSGKETPSLSW
jgi:hypothetical protein